MSDVGGARVGTPGKTYPNRTDLNEQPIRTATGQPYGAAKQQADMQRARPLPGGSPPPGGLFADSARPDEPVTAGVPFGPGRNGPAIQTGAPDQTAETLRALYMAFPDEGLRMLIERYERSGA